ncbi:Modification methylase VspI [Limihaloglobus sulfuriphilus]|uniref:site-specific DNA-methyltransferase (adenine-specific) n=1 Tax=Limihaloglobus sulfuriphilus TaxID=1851148 RepID=A0A1Q2MHL5_9BACT|nr:TaqI-like C-terminal specificity domain-containing protein [Limihaloglobus sulfuriphilus]AQQ72018.1 Modification methylase VspI [Limihaloglobus sulfuriphilus]
MKNFPKQLTLFDDIDTVGLKIEDAACQAGVSTATIRNWIKTGYLKLESKGSVCYKSFDNFLQNVAGTHKLNSRANKSRKDCHDHINVSSEFLRKINTQSNPIDQISDEYESSLSDSYRNKEGIYYTPSSVVEDLFKKPFPDVSTKTFCDPCCGSGNFIMHALNLGFKPENIYGYDCDPVAVAITKARIFEKTGYKTKNIIVADFLSSSLKREARLFDCIYTNPPWGKKLPKDERDFYGRILQAGKSVDTCSLFFFACLRRLEVSGKLGILLPEAFFNISSYETVRLKALNLSIERLIDYGKCFKGLVTKAQAIVLSNKKNKNSSENIVCQTNNTKFMRTSLSFINNPKSIFNFHRGKNDSDVIEHIFSLPHVTLKNNADWGLGIVTGNNTKFCRNTPSAGYMPVYKGSDITKTGLKESHCFIPRDLTQYQQVAPVEMFEAEEKLIYKFISSDLYFFCDTQKRYVLNSINMLIPKKSFPVKNKQLCLLLNCDFINWLFKSIFNTHKILRGDLESLPIHAEYFERHAVFNENTYLSFLNLEKTNNGTYRIKR